MQIASPFSQRNKKGKDLGSFYWSYVIEDLSAFKTFNILFTLKLYFFLFVLFSSSHLIKIIFVEQARETLWRRDSEHYKVSNAILIDL